MSAWNNIQSPQHIQPTSKFASLGGSSESPAPDERASEILRQIQIGSAAPRGSNGGLDEQPRRDPRRGWLIGLLTLVNRDPRSIANETIVCPDGPEVRRPFLPHISNFSAQLSQLKHGHRLTELRQSSQSVTWTDFFAQELFLAKDLDPVHIVHHVYLTPPTDSGPLFVMHHGAGSSGLSFATCADEIQKILPKAGVLSIDARGHGRTTMVPKTQRLDSNNPSTATAAEAELEGQIQLDLSLETLSQDLVYVIRQTQVRMGWENLPDIVLVGHSLGGAVITDVAKSGELGPKLLAYAVLDVVEGENL